MSKHTRYSYLVKVMSIDVVLTVADGRILVMIALIDDGVNEAMVAVVVSGTVEMA